MDSLRGHVGRGADKGICDRINGLCCDTKVAELDVASRIDEDVGRFDITVHNAVGFVEIHQTSQNRLGDLTQHIDPDRAKVFGKAIEGTVSMHERSQQCKAHVLRTPYSRLTTYPQSMYSMHKTISLASFWKAP